MFARPAACACRNCAAIVVIGQLTSEQAAVVDAIDGHVLWPTAVCDTAQALFRPTGLEGSLFDW